VPQKRRESERKEPVIGSFQLRYCEGREGGTRSKSRRLPLPRVNLTATKERFTCS